MKTLPRLEVLEDRLAPATLVDPFAIVAAEIRTARISRKTLALLPGPGNDQMTLGSTSDVRLLEARRTANGGGGP